MQEASNISLFLSLVDLLHSLKEIHIKYAFMIQLKSQWWEKKIADNQSISEQLFQMGPITHNYNSQRLPGNF